MALWVVSAALGTGSLGLFALFLFGVGPRVVETGWSAPARLALDAALSLVFFVQHSGMVRRGFARRLERVVSRPYHGAVYAIASGAALLSVIGLWQPVDGALVTLHGVARWLSRGVFFAAGLGVAWGTLALGTFDALGLDSLARHARGRDPRPVRFTARGPYRFVRHPLYSFILVMIWSCPDLTPDRLLFDLLWTGWIALGASLEERDLLRDLGSPYAEYRSRVPFLLPTRAPLPREPGESGPLW